MIILYTCIHVHNSIRGIEGGRGRERRNRGREGGRERGIEGGRNRGREGEREGEEGRKGGREERD